MTEPIPIVTVDYTDLFRHRNRQFTIGNDVRIGPGIDYVGARWGAGLGVAVALTTGTLFGVVEFPLLPWWLGLILAAATVLAVHTVIRRDDTVSSTGAAVGGVVLVALEMSWLPWWAGMLLGIPVMLVVYKLVSQDSRGQVSPVERTFLAIDYTFRQPSRIHGLGADDAPTDLHWQALLWRPDWVRDDVQFPPPAQYDVTTKGR